MTDLEIFWSDYWFGLIIVALLIVYFIVKNIKMYNKKKREQMNRQTLQYQQQHDPVPASLNYPEGTTFNDMDDDNEATLFPGKDTSLLENLESQRLAVTKEIEKIKKRALALRDEEADSEKEYKIAVLDMQKRKKEVDDTFKKLEHHLKAFNQMIELHRQQMQEV